MTKAINLISTSPHEYGMRQGKKFLVFEPHVGTLLAWLVFMDDIVRVEVNNNGNKKAPIAVIYRWTEGKRIGHMQFYKHARLPILARYHPKTDKLYVNAVVLYRYHRYHSIEGVVTATSD